MNLRNVPPTPCCANCHHKDVFAKGELLDQGCLGCKKHDIVIGYHPHAKVCDDHTFPIPPTERELALKKLTPAERKALGL